MCGTDFNQHTSGECHFPQLQIVGRGTMAIILQARQSPDQSTLSGGSDEWTLLGQSFLGFLSCSY